MVKLIVKINVNTVATDGLVSHQAISSHSDDKDPGYQQLQWLIIDLYKNKKNKIHSMPQLPDI